MKKKKKKERKKEKRAGCPKEKPPVSRQAVKGMNDKSKSKNKDVKNHDNDNNDGKRNQSRIRGEGDYEVTLLSSKVDEQLCITDII